MDKEKVPMDKDKVRKVVREEMNDKEWRDSFMRQFHHDYNRLVLKDMVRTEVDSQTSKMIDGPLRFAVMEHVKNRPDYNEVFNEHKKHLKTNLEQETSLQYQDFKLKCDTYATNHSVLGRYATKDEHNSQASFQSGLNWTIGLGLLGLFGWNMYNHASSDKK